MSTEDELRTRSVRQWLRAISEDGWLYAIDQGGTMRDRVFLELALGAAYTPGSVGRDGRIYAQNAGHLVVASK